MARDVAISIIIVNYKTKDLTLDCLKSVYTECRQEDFEIILVDNNSNDGSAEAFHEQFPAIRFLLLDDNIGFARANNLATHYARGEYILLLNPDTVVLDNAIFRLLAFAKATPGAGIWGGRTVFGDRSLNPPSCWARMTLWSTFCALAGLRTLFPASRLLNPEGYGGWQRDTVREVDIVTGCFLLIRRTLWERLKGFDPIFFMYGEDADLCLRARALGYRPMITPDATIVHYASQSEWLPARKQMQLLAAALTLIDRHWQWPKRLAGRFLLRLFPYARVAGYWMLSQGPNKAKAARQLEVWKAVLEQKQQWISGFRGWSTPQTAAVISPHPVLLPVGEGQDEG
jgi:GT2 family glycosyltransferase